MRESMEIYPRPRGAGDEVQEVLLRATAGKIKWWQARSCRHQRASDASLAEAAG